MTSPATSELALLPSADVGGTNLTSWNPLLKIGFRLSFCYFVLYALCNGNVTLWLALPWIGFAAQYFTSKPVFLAAQWCGQHVFGLTGPAAHLHGGGSGDTALAYVALVVFATVAGAATLIWTTLDWRRHDYGTLLTWLRLALRFTVGISMLTYGMAKLIPMQMREPSLAVLNNTYGNSSPMTLLWTLIGLHPGYEMVCGAAEVLAGILILFRRTAALGVVLTAIVVTNVVLYNFFFDVPVKLYASHLLAMTGFLALPYASAFWRFFVAHQPAQLPEPWIPPPSRKIARVALIVSEWWVLATVTITLTLMVGGRRLKMRDEIPPQLAGAWQIDRVEPDTNANRLHLPDGDIWSVLYFEPGSYGYLRAAGGNLWRCGYQIDGNRSDLRVLGPFGNMRFEWVLQDREHLELKPESGSTRTIHLHRIPEPTTYTLTSRGFHWINEWGYER